MRLSETDVSRVLIIAEKPSVARELAGVLGLLEDNASDGIDREVAALVDERETARKARDFQTADAIRDRLQAMGITLKDTPQGVQILKG